MKTKPLKAWVVGSGARYFSPHSGSIYTNDGKEHEVLTIFSSRIKAEKWRKSWLNWKDLKVARVIIEPVEIEEE